MRKRMPGAQVLAAALERDDVVQRDDLRARRAQQRAVDPRRVEDVDAPRAVRLDDLVLGRAVSRSAVEQAARVAPDPARVARRRGCRRRPSSRARPRAGSPRRGRRRRRRRSAAARSRAAAPIALAVGEHLEHGGGELVGSPGVDEHAGHAVGDDLGEAADARRDDRRAGRHRLGEHGAERLLARRQRRARRGGA